MKTIFYSAQQRGKADFGWLKANYSFSFAGWYEPSKVHFGMLRVLNDDSIAPGMGFGMHPHDNMEIITIPLEGSVEHKDSAGGHGVIKPGEVQVMSAGSGIVHSEFNHSKNEYLKLFQIWIFPNVKNATPRYDQKMFDPAERKNKLQLLAGPKKNGDSLWINQNAFLSRADVDSNRDFKYRLHSERNGVYVMMISGSAVIADSMLEDRDAIGVWDASEIVIKTNSSASLLFIEVPMN